MSSDVPSTLSHVSLGTNDFDRAAAFYDRVMPAIGVKRIMEHPGAVAYGKHFPEFWVQTPFDGKTATTGNGVHVAFLTWSREEVDAFYAAAMEAGATDDGPPGIRAEYNPGYYACFVRDPDGNKIEAMFIDTELAERKTATVN